LVADIARGATATTGISLTEGARTQRAPHRGTAKRIAQKTRQAAPDGALLGRVLCGPGKLAVFDAARSRSYAELFCKKFLVVLVYLTGQEYRSQRRLQSEEFLFGLTRIETRFALPHDVWFIPAPLRWGMLPARCVN
jgi:hypothetical protein